MKKILYLDGETSYNYKTYDEFVKQDPRGAKVFEDITYNRFKDKSIVSLEEHYENTAPLVPEYSRLTCCAFGYKNEGDNKLRTKSVGVLDDEEKTVRESWEIINKFIDDGYKLSGYNILGFDLPLLIKKAIKYKIKVHPKIIQENKLKPWEKSLFIDVAELYNFGFRNNQTSLGVLSWYLDTTDSKNEEVSMGNAPKAYWEGDIETRKLYFEKLKVYSIKDIITTYELHVIHEEYEQ